MHGQLRVQEGLFPSMGVGSDVSDSARTMLVTLALKQGLGQDS